MLLCFYAGAYTVYRGSLASEGGLPLAGAVVVIGSLPPSEGGSHVGQVKGRLGLGCTATLVNLTHGNFSYAITAGHCSVREGDELLVPVLQEGVMVSYDSVATVVNVSSKWNRRERNSNDLAVLLARPTAQDSSRSGEGQRAQLSFGSAAQGKRSGRQWYSLAGYGRTTCEHRAEATGSVVRSDYDPEECFDEDTLSSPAVSSATGVDELIVYRGDMGQGQLRYALLELYGISSDLNADGTVVLAEELRFVVWPDGNASAAVRPGDSGGPCFDASGRLAGVNSGRVRHPTLDMHYCSSVAPHCDWFCRLVWEWERGACLLDCTAAKASEAPPPAAPPPSLPLPLAGSPTPNAGTELQGRSAALIPPRPPPRPKQPFAVPPTPHTFSPAKGSQSVERALTWAGIVASLVPSAVLALSFAWRCQELKNSPSGSVRQILPPFFRLLQ